MNFTFTREELFNPRYNFSTLIVLSVIKTLASEKEIVTNRELFKNNHKSLNVKSLNLLFKNQSK